MSYEIRLVDDGAMLRVDVSGSRENNDPVISGKAAWREIAEECRRRQPRRVLIVSRITGRYGLDQVFDVNWSLPELGVTGQWVIAYVHLDGVTYREVEFGAVIARSRGVNGMLFSNEEAARKWLVRQG